MINDPAILSGIVLTGAHGIYEVHTSEGVIRCTLRGKLKKTFASATRAANSTRQLQRSSKFLSSSQYTRSDRSEKQSEKRLNNDVPPPLRLSVGDYVKIKKLDASTGVIEEILPRQSELARKDAGSSARRVVSQTLLANLDQVVIVLAVAQPDPHFAFLDRYLAICESAELIPLICINKLDLPHDSRVEEHAALYSRLGYRVLWTSTQTNEGIAELRGLLKDHTTLFTGPSGVGKSSLVNAVEPGMALRTGLISSATGKGRHTTTGSQLYRLSDGGWLADSAGIRALSAWDIAPEDLAWCFVEFRPYLGECFYGDCSHVDEDGCAILQAVADELVDEHRHRSYVRMYRGEER